MTTALVQKLSGVRDLKKILETTVKEIGETFSAESCQIMLSNPLDPNVTSICEFRPHKEPLPDNLPVVTMPLVIHGRTFGALSLSRLSEVSREEVNSMRVILGELGDIIRHAQINDIIQRDTFRDTFLVEIGNVMAYSLGIGDALFMVVNILGKVLQASRCLFICTDDTQAGWKCYEFWQQDKVQSCQDYYWPTTHSPLVAQVLLSRAPLKVFEGQLNSYVSPVQDELQLLGVKSLLGVPLRSAEATHGCVILQQCDYRRAWTRGELDMVQNVADKVAEALVKLPAEKRAREPIMQLHQRIVQPADDGDGKASLQSVRRALKGALGQQAIPSARKTSQPPAPPVPPKPAEPAAPPQVAQAQAPPAQAGAQNQAGAQAPPQPGQAAPQQGQAAPQQGQALSQPGQVQAGPGAGGDGLTPTITPVVRGQRPTQEMSPPQPADGAQAVQAQASAQAAQAQAGAPSAQTAQAPQEAKPSGMNAFASLMAPSTVSEPSAEAAPLQAQQTAPHQGQPVHGHPAQGQPGSADPYADLDFGEFTDFTDFSPPGVTQAAQAAEATGAAAAAQESAAAQSALTAEQSATAEQAALKAAQAQQAAQAETSPAQAGEAQSPWGDLDSIPTPKAKAAAPAAAPEAPSQWGDLDSIPTPQGSSSSPSQGGRGLLGKLGKSKGRSEAAQSSALMASFHKDKSQFQPQQQAQPDRAADFVQGPPIEIDEAKAQAKLQEILSSANPTSDYIFATEGLDPRMLGRIDGWVSQIEGKDKYANGHSRHVAQWAVAIAQAIGLSKEDVDVVRQASLTHDVGKLGSAAQILQKRDEELTDPELITVMRHPIDGAELLESFPDLAHLAPIVRAHHEEYNGEGYPAGLKGDEIPVAARIICLANAYHTMVSEMRFGPGMTPQTAQEELRQGAGRQWDPTLVQAFLQLLSEGKVSPS